MLSLRRRPSKTCDGLKILHTLLDDGEPELQMGRPLPDPAHSKHHLRGEILSSSLPSTSTGPMTGGV
jgi:hypothetical protein